MPGQLDMMEKNEYGDSGEGLGSLTVAGAIFDGGND